MPTFLDGLNDAQKHAVLATNGPLLIVAGAGSGKTRVIAHRILNLVKTGTAPHQILAITFTNKAAREMRERVSALLAEDRELNRPISSTERPFVSTFHALGVHIIRENARLLGLTKHFTIYDRADSKRAIKEAMVGASIDPKKYDPGVFLNMISRAKGDGKNATMYRDTAHDLMEEMAADIWDRYDAILLKEKSLDFDDLLLKTSELLSRPDVREHYARIWKYIHIDEYQDTNRVQYKIANYLSSTSRNICVVGDADQNIYSWRGATIENILNFEKDYPDATVITLEKNYRSTKTILAAANAVIEKNIHRKKKTLTTDNPVGEKITLASSYTEGDEARGIADETKRLLDSGVSATEIAVLYRTNFQSRVLEEAFIKKNIPYQLLGVKFFERKEVKDVLSYVRLALNRDSMADMARIINVPARGIGKVTFAKIAAGEESSLPEGMHKKMADFRALLDDIAAEIAEKKPSDAIRFIIQESGLERALLEGDLEDEDRLLNIRELVSVASQYDHLPISEAMDTFMTNAALATDQDELDDKKEQRDSVKLMTVHAAKGLEFDYVFIAGLEQNLFPFKHLDEDELNEAGAEEERRLFYVAITRARKKLRLSYALVRNMYGIERVNTQSEFIQDIHKNLIEEDVPKRSTGVKAIFIDF
ncbi:MAG TPA: UvrD-helicase domain-containing protein [Candidatus Paceibacterota bacterium]